MKTPKHLRPLHLLASVALLAASTAHAACKDEGVSELTRFWELERASGCGVFGIRSYRPISMSVIASDSVNRQPTSENPVNNVSEPRDFSKTETRIQLSVRSKLAEGLLTGRGSARQDSLWFGYTQRSYWQLFNGGISRPFRNTDHEPEVMYVYPIAADIGGGWNLRYGGAGLVHQSNGQSLPYSRSWNRTYLMAGADHPSGWMVQGRLWHRIKEDAATDDNPGISDFVGRAELTTGWKTRAGHALSVTWRNNLRDLDKGSARLDWMVPIDGEARQFGSLRLHTQLFTGYGDSLLDYNRRRTVLSLGVSLVDW